MKTVFLCALGFAVGYSTSIYQNASSKRLFWKGCIYTQLDIARAVETNSSPTMCSDLEKEYYGNQ